MRGKRSSRLIYFVIMLIVIAADQITKKWIAATVVRYEKIEVISGFLNITHVKNPGAAFGLGSNSEWAYLRPFFIAVSMIAFAIVIYFFLRNKDNSPMLNTGLSLMGGGAIGNLIDRIKYGEVIDFIDVHWSDLHWPTFNVADSAITVGVTLLMINILFLHKETSDEGERQESAARNMKRKENSA